MVVVEIKRMWMGKCLMRKSHSDYIFYFYNFCLLYSYSEMISINKNYCFTHNRMTLTFITMIIYAK